MRALLLILALNLQPVGLDHIGEWVNVDEDEDDEDDEAEGMNGIESDAPADELYPHAEDDVDEDEIDESEWA